MKCLEASPKIKKTRILSFQKIYYWYLELVSTSNIGIVNMTLAQLFWSILDRGRLTFGNSINCTTTNKPFTNKNRLSSTTCSEELQKIGIVSKDFIKKYQKDSPILSNLWVFFTFFDL